MPMPCSPLGKNNPFFSASVLFFVLLFLQAVLFIHFLLNLPSIPPSASAMRTFGP
jgi:hypothetical protein